jgi:hypothetical protein
VAVLLDQVVDIHVLLETLEEQEEDPPHGL